ncbi:MAG TPA: hypothetical protein VMB50_16405 [Myxococcales bacterium]|nr:hypothetical protein [Myxococcales bacterium]
MVAAIALVAALVAAAPQRAASLTPSDRLDQAEAALENFRDADAKAVLVGLLHHAPQARVAARAHLFLGIIAFNDYDTTTARAEFKQALALDPGLDLPIRLVSPKVSLLFAEARRDLFREVVAQGDVPPPAVLEAPAAPTKYPGRMASYWVLGGAAVAAGVGAYFGVDQTNALSEARAATDSGTGIADLNRFTRDGILADVLYGVGGVGAVVALVLFFAPGGDRGERPSVTVAPTAGGAMATVAF